MVRKGEIRVKCAMKKKKVQNNKCAKKMCKKQQDVQKTIRCTKKEKQCTGT